MLPDLLLMRADGSGRRRITDTGAIEGSAAWSPDGDRIVFERTWPGYAADLWTVDPATGDETNLIGTPGTPSCAGRPGCPGVLGW